MRMTRRWGGPLVALAAGLALVYRQALAGNVYFGRDAMRFFIPDSSFLREALTQGEVPLWIPYLRLGQPFLATLQAQVLYPPRLLTTLLFGPIVGFTVHQVLHAALAAGGAFWAARRLGARRGGAALAGIAFGLGPLLTDLAGQRNVVDAAAWSGFIVAAADLLLRRPSAARAGALAVFVAASLAAGSPEVTLSQGVIAALLCVRRFRRAGWVALGVGWGAVAMAAVLLPAWEFVRHSARARGVEDPLQWSASGWQLLGTLWPFAEHPRGPYWGGPDQWFVLTVFMGTAVWAAAAGAVGKRRALPLGLSAALFALLALGRHVPPAAALLSLPPFSLFRYPGRYLVALSFVVALLAALGVGRWAARARRRSGSIRWAAVVVVAFVAALPVGDALLQAVGARSGARGGWLWVCAVVALFAGILLAAPSGRHRGRRVGAALIALAALEIGAFHLLHVDSGWIAPAVLRRPSAMAAAIPDGFDGRISLARSGDVDPTSPEAGRDTVRISRDVLLAKRHIEERLHALEGYGAPEPEWERAFNLSGARAVYELAAVSYFVRRGPPPFEDLAPVLQVEDYVLYRSPTAMPRAFVVHRAEVVDDAAALRAVQDPSQPARHTAFLASGQALPGASCTGSAARITSETANTLDLEVTACAPGYLIVSDAWFPGWRAWVDGVPAPVHRADYALRAVPVPEGTHPVALRYAPASFRWGVALSALAWLALGAVASRRLRAHGI